MKTTHSILNLLIPIADGIAKTIGPNCEVAIHDLTHPQHSIFYIINGHLTGRKQGDSLGPIFKELVQIAKSNEDMIINYYDNIEGHSFKATKVLINDEHGKVIGCFCINIVIDDYMQALETLNQICETTSIKSFRENTEEENNEDQISDLVSGIILNTYQDMKKSKKRLTKTEKLDFVGFLEEKGIFRVKGSVELVAGTLGVSKFSIYSYLDEIRTKNNE